MSVKLTLRDGFWYVDIRKSPAGQFKSKSRHSNFNEAFDAAKAFALKHGMAA